MSGLGGHFYGRWSLTEVSLIAILVKWLLKRGGCLQVVVAQGGSTECVYYIQKYDLKNYKSQYIFHLPVFKEECSIKFNYK